MGLVAEYLNEIYKRHRRNVEDHLKGHEVKACYLWLSVGYFLHGHGAHEDKSFASPEQWEQLVTDTGRRREASIL